MKKVAGEQKVAGEYQKVAWKWLGSSRKVKERDEVVSVVLRLCRSIIVLSELLGSRMLS